MIKPGRQKTGFTRHYFLAPSTDGFLSDETAKLLVRALALKATVVKAGYNVKTADT